MSNNLYHFTSKHHLPVILKAGYLKLTDDMLAFDYSNRRRKPVVWLTSSQNPNGHSLEGSIADKKEIMFTLEPKPHYQYWRTWAKKNKIDKNMAEFLNGEEFNAGSWWISEKTIPLSDVLRIENRYTGQVYFDQAIKIYSYAPMSEFTQIIANANQQ